MGTVIKDQLYVFGGSLNDPEMRTIHVELATMYGLRAPYNGVPNYRDAYCYDGGTDIWHELRHTPFPVIAGTALAIDDRYILLMGTSDTPTLRVGASRENIGIRVKGNASETFWRGYGDRILCYDIEQNNYSHVGVMPYGVATSHWVFHRGQVYSFGGEPAHGFNLNTETVLQIGTIKPHRSTSQAE
jgi:N-acetylneuraminic acid mutarotase